MIKMKMRIGNKIRNKKGQLEINETILVIFIFSVLLLIGLIVFNRFTAQGIDDMVDRNEKIKFVNMLAGVTNMAELKCSSQATDVECLDTLKLLAFKKQSGEYFDRFGYKKVVVEVVYPDVKGAKEIECTNANYPNCGYWLIYEREQYIIKAEEIISSAVSLYYPFSELYGVGKLKATRYS